MAYNRDLAERIREALAEYPAREANMFGGLSFFVNEKIAVSANTHGDLMVRCDPAHVDALLGEKRAQQAEMRGRQMSKGWLRIGLEEIENDQDLYFWIDAALQYNKKVTSNWCG